MGGTNTWMILPPPCLSPYLLMCLMTYTLPPKPSTNHKHNHILILLLPPYLLLPLASQSWPPSWPWRFLHVESQAAVRPTLLQCLVAGHTHVYLQHPTSGSFVWLLGWSVEKGKSELLKYKKRSKRRIAGWWWRKDDDKRMAKRGGRGWQDSKDGSEWVSDTGRKGGRRDRSEVKGEWKKENDWECDRLKKRKRKSAVYAMGIRGRPPIKWEDRVAEWWNTWGRGG